MEPVFMVLGQSASELACLAIDQETSVQEVAYETLKTRLVQGEQVLDFE
jgi:hypothetical protein